MKPRVAPPATPTSVVRYCWTALDRTMAGLHSTVTPYAIPADQLNQAWRYEPGTFVPIPLGLSLEPATVSRFFRDGYEWVTPPEDVPTGGLMIEYFGRLHAHDPIRFAHLDPALVLATNARRAAARVERMQHASLDLSSPGNIADLPAGKGLDPGMPRLQAAAAVLDVGPGIPEMMPFEDLVRLHIEYWGNSPFRGEFLRQRAFAFTAEPVDVLRLIPMFVPFFQVIMKTLFGVADFLPAAAMTQAEMHGKRLEWVLARKPNEGVPILTAGTPTTERRPTRVVTTMRQPRIELDGFGTQELLPFHLKQWDTTRSRLAFRVTLPDAVARTRIEIRARQRIVFAEDLESVSWCSPGVHIWTWDGFDAEGVFDTRLLKRERLEVRVTTVDLEGRTALARTHVSSQPGTVRWVDARLDRKTRTAEVTTYLRFRSPSELEATGFQFTLPKPLGEVVHAMTTAMGGLETSLAPLHPVDLEPDHGATLDELLDHKPLVDMVRPPSIAPLLNKHLCNVSITCPKMFDLPRTSSRPRGKTPFAGVGIHWSRDVRLDGEPWVLSTTASERSVDAMTFFQSREISDVAVGEFGWKQPMDANGSPVPLLPDGLLDRSVNLATFLEGLPILNAVKAVEAPISSQYVGAHELGHSVLREAYDPITSATHKGTSSVFGNKRKATYLDPSAAELDVMHYLDVVDLAPRARARACEDDARALIWMARVIVG
ncbi:MAG: hypothetical protein U0414_39135 [Polyangiaceae bacterium]